MNDVRIRRQKDEMNKERKSTKRQIQGLSNFVWKKRKFISISDEVFFTAHFLLMGFMLYNASAEKEDSFDLQNFS